MTRSQARPRRTCRLRRALRAGAALFTFASLTAAQAHAGEPPGLPEDFLSPRMPSDVEPGGAPDATLEQAALFAWREWIALQWPAAKGLRGVPEAKAPLEESRQRTRVWETLRARVEVYPGMGSPVRDAKARDYDFDAPPRYIYDSAKVGGWNGAEGATVPCDGSKGGEVPWHNLDEPNHDGGHAGSSESVPYPGQQILLETKANRTHYVYAISRGWYGDAPMRLSKKRTGDYVRTRQDAPPPSGADDPQDTQLVSFPTGAMEIKAAWRRLGVSEGPARFLTAPVRYYERGEARPCHRDSGSGRDRWALIAMHIMHKTPTAPYFVWATFEHVDNLVSNDLGADGKVVRIEEDDGTPTAAGSRVSEAYTPAISVVPATLEEDQQVRFAGTDAASPGPGLYFRHLPGFGLPGVSRVAINARLHRTPAAIAKVNRLAQAAIRARFPDSPLQYYRLVSVQWKPLGKPPSVPYEGPEDPAIYYAANVIIEPSPVHQSFSGQFTSGFAKSSDFLHRQLVFLNPAPNPGAPVFLNVFYKGRGYLAGGCMGCHGARQAYGTDWSFILDRQRVAEPEFPK